MSAPRPVLALVGSGPGPSRSVPLLGVLGIEAEVVSWAVHERSGRPAPDAVLVSEVELLEGLPAVPVAVWVDDHEDLGVAAAARVEAALSHHRELVGQGVVFVPRTGIDTNRWPPIAPLVRQRWRHRFGLPRELVVGLEPGAHPDDLPTDLALASVAVVTGPATVLALALGTPVVTSPDTADRLGLRPGLDAEVAEDPDGAAGLARSVAVDEERAAALSRRGRRFAERHLDLGAPAATLRRRLSLGVSGPLPIGPRAVVERRLAELATPAPSPLRHRVDAALHLFPASTAGASP